MYAAWKVLGTLMIGWVVLHPFVFYLFSPGMRKTRAAKNFFVGGGICVGVPGIAYLVTVL
jgi:hypothetical protein